MTGNQPSPMIPFEFLFTHASHFPDAAEVDWRLIRTREHKPLAVEVAQFALRAHSRVAGASESSRR